MTGWRAQPWRGPQVRAADLSPTPGSQAQGTGATSSPTVSGCETQGLARTSDGSGQESPRKPRLRWRRSPRAPADGGDVGDIQGGTESRGLSARTGGAVTTLLVRNLPLRSRHLPCGEPAPTRPNLKPHWSGELRGLRPPNLVLPKSGPCGALPLGVRTVELSQGWAAVAGRAESPVQNKLGGIPLAEGSLSVTGHTNSTLSEEGLKFRL